MLRFLLAPWRFLREPLRIPVMVFRETTPPEPPDPITVPREECSEAVQARIDAGLKPWPSLPDDHYFNSIIGTCSICGTSIYGGQAISIGPKGTRCIEHFNRGDLDP